MKPSEIFRSKFYNKNGFYNIMPISNLASVLKYGILSNELAGRIPHKSVAMNVIQDKRDQVTIPNGLELHQYANLYIDARNPMLYKRKDEDIIVLKVDCRILDLPDVVVSDQNASSSYVRFYEPEEAMQKLDFELVFARSWEDDNQIEYWKKKSAKCAEVLVPGKIEPSFIIAAAVKSDIDKDRILTLGFDRRIYVNGDLFFKKEVE